MDEMTLDKRAELCFNSGMAKYSAFYFTEIAPAHQDALSLPKETVADGLVLFKAMR